MNISVLSSEYNTDSYTAEDPLEAVFSSASSGYCIEKDSCVCVQTLMIFSMFYRIQYLVYQRCYSAALSNWLVEEEESWWVFFFAVFSGVTVVEQKWLFN